MIAAILGLPGTGKRTLAQTLRTELRNLYVIGFDAIRTTLKTSSTRVAIRARDAVEAGHLVPDLLLGQLMAEMTLAQPHPVLLQGYPRNTAQLTSLESAAHQSVFIVHLRASEGLVDERQRAMGRPRIEESHPRAFARLTEAFEPMLIHARSKDQLLDLDATLPPAELAAAIALRLPELGPRT